MNGNKALRSAAGQRAERHKLTPAPVPCRQCPTRRVRLTDVRPDLDISVRHGSEETVVALAGEIDIHTVPRLVTAVEDSLANGPSRLLLDMGEVTFCDSQGLGTLVVLNRTATRARSSLVLTNVGSFLDRLLEVTGLRHAFTIRASETPNA